MRGELLGLVKAMLTEDSMNRNVLQKQIDQAEYSMNYLMDEERLAQIEAEEADAEDEEEEESVSIWHFLATFGQRLCLCLFLDNLQKVLIETHFDMTLRFKILFVN